MVDTAAGGLAGVPVDVRVDASLCAGAITVARDPACFDADPFARLCSGTLVRTSLFSEVDPPPGPVVERYAGAPWPGGAFG